MLNSLVTFSKNYKGLSKTETENGQKIFQNGSLIQAYSPSNLKIIVRNTFTIMTIALLPLIIGMLSLEIYKEALILLLFVFTGSATNTIEELRVKKRLEKLKNKFNRNISVIREDKEVEILIEDLVVGDIVHLKEGDPILFNSKILEEKYLLVDKSGLTGESDYFDFKTGEELNTGMFIVTGECIAKVLDNSANELAEKIAKTTDYQRKQSKLEKIGLKIIYIFTFFGLLASASSFLVARLNGFSTEEAILGTTSIVGVSIPQTLIIVLVLTFVVSITKLAKKGILVQKRGAIDDISDVDMIFIDKTGTITSNELKVVNYFENTDISKTILNIFNAANKYLYGRNKTHESIYEYLNNNVGKGRDLSEQKILENNFVQIPFTSTRKYSLFGTKENSIILGAEEIIEQIYNPDQKSKIKKWISTNKKEGNRILLGAVLENLENEDLENEIKSAKAKKIFAFSIKEQLNPGVEKVLKELISQGIEVKVLSGDAKASIERVLSKMKLKDFKSIDCSDKNLNELDLENHSVFCRLKPTDKVEIVKYFRSQGKNVAMIGDGLNDVLAIKEADVGIAMEYGNETAKEVSDIILLKNNYKNIPTIFYEGRNIIFNIKLTAKIFFTRSALITVAAFLFILEGLPFPLYPNSTLIFNFLGSSLAAYLLVFARQNKTDDKPFFKDAVISSIPIGFAFGLIAYIFFQFIRDEEAIVINTAMVILLLGQTLGYTIFTIWNSGKLGKSILAPLIALLAGVIFGIMQTYLPIRSIESNEGRILAGIIIGIGVFAIFSFFKFMAQRFPKDSKRYSRLAVLLPIPFVPAAIFFPWRDYYSVTGLSFEILGLSVLGIIFSMITMILIDRVFINRIQKLWTTS